MNSVETMSQMNGAFNLSEKKSHSGFWNRTGLAIEKGLRITQRAIHCLPEWADAGKSALIGAVGPLAENSETDLQMAFWKEGTPLELTPRAIAAAFPQPTQKVCILIHGLCCNENFWRYPKDKNISYGTLLEADLAYTSLFVRYNTGRHISENGQSLSELIERLVESYPTAIEEIILIGHSMGGLVIRSACHYGQLGKHAWVKAVKHIFLLASPQLGAPLEKWGNLTSAILKAIPSRHTTLLGEIINLRSDGIKDLRFGYLVEEDWCGADPDCLLQNHRNQIDLLPGVAYYIVTGTLNQDPGHAVTILLGDVLVRQDSAKGIAARKEDSIPFSQENCRVFYGINHIALAYHHQVYEQIRNWLKASNGKNKETSHE